MLFSAFLWVSGISWENLGVIFCVFCGFPGFPGRTWVLFSALLWGFRDFLGEPGWKQLGMGLGELQELVRGKVAGGWPAILTRYFDPQFPNFCRRRCRPLWPAGLPRFEI